MTDDENIPPSDDNDKENPFEEFINKDLGMENVLKDGISRPADDKSFPSTKNAFDDDEDDLTLSDDDESDDDSFSSTTRFGRLGSAPRPPNPFSSNLPFGGSRFGGSSSGYNSPFGRSSSGSNNFNSNFGGLGSGNSTPPGSFSSRFAPPPKLPTPAIRKSFSARMWSSILGWGAEQLLVIMLALVMLLIVISTMLYIDNLRLRIAVSDGQINELRHQLDDLHGRLGITPTTSP